MKYNEKKSLPSFIKIQNYKGLNSENTPVKIIVPQKPGNKVVILYPGASPTAENHPKMEMLGGLLAQIGFRVYIPRIPPLKNLDISDINVQWFISFYQWILDAEKVDPQQTIMVGISYGGGIMLRAIFEIKDKLKLPKTILTYGTYSNFESIMKFLLSGKISIDGKTYQRIPHEWGLIIIFHNYMKNLNIGWDTSDLQRAIKLQIQEKKEECDAQVNQLPKFQKDIFYSIITSNLTTKVKELAGAIIKKERESLNKLSPIFWAKEIQKKVFILHGANDSMVPFTESIQLAELLPNSELLISHLYEHDEISANRGIFFNFMETIKFINFYAKVLKHFEN